MLETGVIASFFKIKVKCLSYRSGKVAKLYNAMNTFRIKLGSLNPFGVYVKARFGLCALGKAFTASYCLISIL